MIWDQQFIVIFLTIPDCSSRSNCSFVCLYQLSCSCLTEILCKYLVKAPPAIFDPISSAIPNATNSPLYHTVDSVGFDGISMPEFAS